MLTFAAAVLFLIGPPGPGVLSIAGVGASLHRLNLTDTAQGRINGFMAAALLTVVSLALAATIPTGDTP